MADKLFRRTITEVVDYPDHAKRTASALFRRNSRKLIKTLDTPCWICGGRGAREVHHIHEWSMWNALDPERVLDTLRVFDPYGFTAAHDDLPLTSPDDLRNLLVLCGDQAGDGVRREGGHHRGLNQGVHNLTFAVWLAQRSVRPGIDVTPFIKRVQGDDDKLTTLIDKIPS